MWEREHAWKAHNILESNIFWCCLAVRYTHAIASRSQRTRTRIVGRTVRPYGKPLSPSLPSDLCNGGVGHFAQHAFGVALAGEQLLEIVALVLDFEQIERTGTGGRGGRQRRIVKLENLRRVLVGRYPPRLH